jgi:hypothetical protein
MDMNFAKMLVVIALVSAVGQVANAQQLSQRDQLRIAVQDICPISGQKLGAHGAPIKVKVGEETIFLCCRGCLQSKINPQHWASIHANFANAQGICPVMKHKLPKNPKWTIVDGQIIFVCCPPCTDKIAADPATYLRKIDELYSAALEQQRPRR